MYEILFESKAEKELLELPKEDLKRIDTKIRQLNKNPRPPGIKKLVGKIEGWRIRAGDYRILYQIDDEKKLVKVYRIKHRREVYR
ncbi:MAG: type II toxin-antitoxin system RelE/ParE family toxin [Bacteroidales bacterium]|nr:type II toxin-antitoxin system RelE/ParE family toxin [Bacteroidales bacterium]